MPRRPSSPGFLTRKQLAVVHIAKQRLDLDEDTYRTVLRDAAGVDSAKELDTAGFGRVMDFFTRMGFTSDWRRESLGERAGRASPGQVVLIRKLWCEWSEDGTEAGLNAWLERKYGCSALPFATPEVAAKAINGLRAMVARKRAA